LLIEYKYKKIIELKGDFRIMKTKNEFIEGISLRLEVKKIEAEKILNTFLEVIEQALLEDGEVKIGNHFALEVKTQKARKARNPKTGEDIYVPSKKVVKAKIFKSLKDLIK
jgi:nucleoid DNA-binding protein